MERKHQKAKRTSRKKFSVDKKEIKSKMNGTAIGLEKNISQMHESLRRVHDSLKELEEKLKTKEPG